MDLMLLLVVWVGVVDGSDLTTKAVEAMQRDMAKAPRMSRGLRPKRSASQIMNRWWYWR